MAFSDRLMEFLALFVLYAAAVWAVMARRGLPSSSATASGVTAARPSRLLIVGATGGTGHQLVAQALKRGYEVTAMVRDPSKLQVDHPRLNGELADYDLVLVFAKKVEKIWCVLSLLHFGHGGGSPDSSCSVMC